MWFKVEKTNEIVDAKVAEMDRRREPDRRTFGRAKFPVINRIGKLINRDRRSMPDRRIAKIEVNELDVNFDKNQFKKN